MTFFLDFWWCKNAGFRACVCFFQYNWNTCFSFGCETTRWKIPCNCKDVNVMRVYFRMLPSGPPKMLHSSSRRCQAIASLRGEGYTLASEGISVYNSKISTGCLSHTIRAWYWVFSFVSYVRRFSEHWVTLKIAIVIPTVIPTPKTYMATNNSTCTTKGEAGNIAFRGANVLFETKKTPFL